METYQSLIAQRDALDQKIKAARQEALVEGVRQAQAIIAEFQLLRFDVFPKSGSGVRRARGAAEPKYRDPSTGTTWSGRGRAPRWIDKSRIDAYLIPKG